MITRMAERQALQGLIKTDEDLRAREERCEPDDKGQISDMRDQIKYAIDVFQELKPHVLGRWEMCDADTAYLEMRSKKIVFPVLVATCGLVNGEVNLIFKDGTNVDLDVCDLGKTWRLWNRYTYADEREAVPWDCGAEGARSKACDLG